MCLAVFTRSTFCKANVTTAILKRNDTTRQNRKCDMAHIAVSKQASAQFCATLSCDKLAWESCLKDIGDFITGQNRPCDISLRPYTNSELGSTKQQHKVTCKQVINLFMPFNVLLWCCLQTMQCSIDSRHFYSLLMVQIIISKHHNRRLC